MTFPTIQGDVLIHNGTAAFTNSSFTNATLGTALILNGATVQISGCKFSNNSAGAVQAGDSTLTVAPTKTLSLKRPVEAGIVRQSFSHGRTKAVVVEKVKRRTLGPGEAHPPREATPAPAPAS